MFEEKFFAILTLIGAIVLTASVVVGVCMLCILMF